MVYRTGIKRRIRLGILLAALLCAIGFCTFSSGATAASKKVALDYTSMKMTKGRPYRLRLLNARGTVTWKSSKKSVATVSKSGKILAVSCGTCTITAKNRGKTYSCKVKVYNSSRQYLTSILKKRYKVSKNQGKILLAGSSSMEYWTSAASAFAPYEIMNVGIGGTVTSDWERLYKSLIVKYKPSAVVLYIGSNDIGNSGNGSRTAAKTRRLLQKIQKALPDTPIYYVSICPSIKRCGAWEEIRICNKEMKTYCAQKKNLYYINVESYFWKNGKPNASLYSSDELHLNQKGYKIWRAVIAPKVKKGVKKVNNK